MTAYRYLHYDVFTDTRFEGNPLAVLPDARGLSAGQMQTIAREMAFSETTFVLPAEQRDTDVRMRIFTPARELPMAGHPTIGTTFALAHEGVIRAGAEQFVFGLGVGPTAVALEWQREALSFAWMTQRVPEFGPTFDDAAARDEIARAVGLEVADLASDVPVEVASSGVPFVFIPLRSREAVDRAAPRSTRCGGCRWTGNWTTTTCSPWSRANLRRPATAGCSPRRSASPRTRRPAAHPGPWAATSCATAWCRRPGRPRS